MQKNIFEFIQNEQAKLKDQRHTTADQDYQRAIQALITAIQQGFTDKNLLVQATQHFTIAMRRHRKDPKPYIGMAYLWLLVGEPIQALRYLKEVLRFSPEHPTVLLLLQSLQLNTKPRLSPSSSLSGPSSYVQLQNLLHTVMENSQKSVSPQISLDPQVLEKLRQETKILQDFKTQFDVQLKKNTHNLHLEEIKNLLNPLESLLLQYQSSAKQSEAFQKINAQIQTTLQLTKSCFKELNSFSSQIQTPDFQKKLEEIYDICDQLADQLDSLEGLGMDIGLLEREYELLMTYVQCLQERMDDDF